MVSANIEKWLKKQRRNRMMASSVYAVVAVAGGSVATGLTFCVAFECVKIFALVLAPASEVANGVSATLASCFIVFLWVDSGSASRYESDIIEGWLLRESLEAGPRAIRDGIGAAQRAARLARLDISICAGALTLLAARGRAIARADLEKQIPGLAWSALVRQLRDLEGILFLGPGVSRIGLVAPLKAELYRLWKGEKHAKEPAPEPPREPSQEQAPPEAAEQPHHFTPAELLGVSASASRAEIKAAYRRRMKECHPDRFAGTDEYARQQAEEWTKAINAAYETLMAGQTEGRTEG